MANTAIAKFYPPAEERINIASHALGLLLSVAGLPILLWQAVRYGSAVHLISASVFGVSLVVLYASSTIYHSATNPDIRMRLRIVDHASIFFLIAGTYTPFTLLVFDGAIGWVIFVAVWSLALTGVVLKLFYTGRYRRTSTAMYLLTGWMIVFAIESLIANLPANGLAWLIAGGLSYSIGAVLYGIKAIPFNHALFHLFVLFGSASHYIAVLLYVLPGA